MARIGAMRPQRPAVAIAIVFLFLVTASILACHSPTSPSDSATVTEHGRLSGIVTIGPNCPGPETTNPCPTPPSAYAARKILIYNEAKTNLLFTVDIDSQGAYLIDLTPARYTVDLKRNGIDHTSDLPQVVEIKANTVTRIDVNIDTGIR
jgi:hypothetical protein